MKRFILLILPVVFIMTACNNNNKTEVVVAKQDTVAPAPDTTAAKVKPAGSVPMPAQVFEDISLKPIAGATITAKDADRLIETATSNAQGMYTCSRLTTGKSYNYTITKTGYASQTTAAVYEGNDNSLPGFALKK